MISATFTFFTIVTIIAPIFGKYISYIFFNDRLHLSIPNISKNKILKQQDWRRYFFSLMSFNLICIFTSFIIIFFQEYFPASNNVTKELNFAASLNAAISFSTSTFWHGHNAEEGLTIFSQIFGLTMQNFASSATGIAVFMAFIRGILNNNNQYIGNFYDDFFRGFIFILLPISAIISLVLIYFGVPHDFTGVINYENLEGSKESLFVGPAAGQMAIKHLAANGGSIFNAGSAHPFEAPSRTVIMIELFAIVIMPIASIFAYGFCIKNIQISWALYVMVIIVMVASLYVLNIGETDYSVPLILEGRSLDDNFNYTGKGLIYDKFPSLMWVLSITMSSDGSANACLENYSPLSTVVLFSNIVVSKFVMEGVGSGFFAMLAYLIVSVFLRGLIAGKSTNFFGKKITINEINYVIIVFLITPVGVLIFTGITLLLSKSQEIITYHGSQAITDIAYNFASAFTNNGSNFSGVDITSNYFNYMTGLAMFIGRYTIIYYSLAISGSFACKKKIHKDIDIHDQSAFELSIFLLITVTAVGAIMFTPLLILGPLVEFMSV